MKRTPESIVKIKVKKVLDEFCVWYYMPVPSPLGRAGIPDIMGILPWDGRALGIETKAPGKKNNATENQKRFISEMNTAGGVAFVTDDAEEVRTKLNACKQEAQKNHHCG